MKLLCHLTIAFGTWTLLAPVVTVANEPLQKDSEDANQWVIPLGSYSGIRHSKLSQINSKNAGKLQVAWTMSTGTLRGQEVQPLVVGNMMYFESSYPNFVYAIDLDKFGHIVWKFSLEQDKFSPSVACCDLVNKGVAYADGKILVSTLDKHVYALDAKTGKVLWSARNGDPQLGQTMTIAPLVVHDKVIVGISGGEYGVRGHLSAYDLNSGKMVWRANSVGPDSDILFDPNKAIDAATQQPVGPDSSLKTWTQDNWNLGGGTTWG
jgi:PQQ-dependent dehydrogenase (methanol/ethanol family)